MCFINTSVFLYMCDLCLSLEVGVSSSQPIILTTSSHLHLGTRREHKHLGKRKTEKGRKQVTSGNSTWRGERSWKTKGKEFKHWELEQGTQNSTSESTELSKSCKELVGPNQWFLKNMTRQSCGNKPWTAGTLPSTYLQPPQSAAFPGTWTGCPFFQTISSTLPGPWGGLLGVWLDGFHWHVSFHHVCLCRSGLQNTRI